MRKILSLFVLFTRWVAMRTLSLLLWYCCGILSLCKNLPAMFRDFSAATLRTRSNTFPCPSWSPWEKLKRKTLAPASINCPIPSSLQEAGPMVQMIFVRRCWTLVGAWTRSSVMLAPCKRGVWAVLESMIRVWDWTRSIDRLVVCLFDGWSKDGKKKIQNQKRLESSFWRNSFVALGGSWWAWLLGRWSGKTLALSINNNTIYYFSTIL